MSIKNILFAVPLFSLLAAATNAADLVVIGHPSGTALTESQVADLYLGKTQSGALYDYADSSPIYADFYNQATGRSVAQVKSTWARLVFSGRAQAPKQLPDSAAIKKAVAGEADAIGYIEKSAVDSSVKVLLELN